MFGKADGPTTGCPALSEYKKLLTKPDRDALMGQVKCKAAVAASVLKS